MALIELLAPAGSVESMKAAVSAGADAVYMGGTRFGARAYAENPEEDQLLEAIEYVHLHGRKLYLTVNTLLKENELEEELYAYLRPYYEAGVDAVIVQDFGVLKKIRQWFPDLPVHASTQMTLTGAGSALELERLGASRIVTPRELSLKEIAAIRKSSELEIETFVHGALCYCYSGQCLYSSMVGGRSGNRGRCAQPCRLEYQLFDRESGGRALNAREERYLLSPKDLNALKLIPDMIDAGVNSFKIEGRMKKPVYAAGVVTIYRKYIDLYRKEGRRGYRIDPADEQRLWDLFNRKGFTEGYFRQHNGRDMITLTKPDFRPGNDSFMKMLQERYIDTELQEKIKGSVMVRKYMPVTMELSCRGISVRCEGDVPMEAESRPASEESIRKQMSKFGGTGFALEELRIDLEDGLFVPVGALNALRRKTADALREQLLRIHRRESSAEQMTAQKEAAEVSAGAIELSVSVETMEQLEAVLQQGGCDRIYLDCLIAAPSEWRTLADQVRSSGAQAFLTLPRIFRERERRFFNRNLEVCRQAGFDGYLVRTIEELAYLQEHDLKGSRISDHMLYTYNHEAANYLLGQGMTMTTMPLELNEKECRERGTEQTELILYGRLPMMISAQCLKKTTGKCDGCPCVSWLRDRTGAMLPVQSVCTFCYNVILNGHTMSVLEDWETILRMKPASVRLSFTIESGAQVRTVWNCFADIREGKQASLNLPGLTRGHFRRGVL